MSRLLIWFIAVIAVTFSFNKVESSSSAIDLNAILELVRQQRLNSGSNKPRIVQLRHDSSDTDSYDSDDDDSDSDDSDDSDSNRYGRIRKERIIDLIEKVRNDKSDRNDRNENEDRIVYQQAKPSYGQNSFVSYNDRYDAQANNNPSSQVLEYLLNNGLIPNKEERKIKHRKPVTYKAKLKPNRLTTNINMKEISDYFTPKKDNAIGLEDYSKVYVVLNPQSVNKSKNKKALNDLISKILSLSSSSSNSKNDRQVKRKPRHYKGFVLNDDRESKLSRQSNEIYVPSEPLDRISDNYNSPKKSRNNRGNANGRAALQFRGANVYEN